MASRTAAINERQRLGILDGLRGMTCLWVLIGHVSSSKSGFLIIYYALAKPLHWVENLGVAVGKHLSRKLVARSAEAQHSKMKVDETLQLLTRKSRLQMQQAQAKGAMGGATAKMLSRIANGGARPRVIVHTSEPTHGHAQYVSEVVLALAKSGVPVVLFCPANFEYETSRVCAL